MQYLPSSTPSQLNMSILAWLLVVRQHAVFNLFWLIRSCDRDTSRGGSWIRSIRKSVAGTNANSRLAAVFCPDQILLQNVMKLCIKSCFCRIPTMAGSAIWSTPCDGVSSSVRLDWETSAWSTRLTEASIRPRDGAAERRVDRSHRLCFPPCFAFFLRGMTKIWYLHIWKHAKFNLLQTQSHFNIFQ